MAAPGLFNLFGRNLDLPVLVGTIASLTALSVSDSIRWRKEYRSDMDRRRENWVQEFHQFQENVRNEREKYLKERAESEARVEAPREREMARLEGAGADKKSPPPGRHLGEGQRVFILADSWSDILIGNSVLWKQRGTVTNSFCVPLYYITIFINRVTKYSCNYSYINPCKWK